MILCVCIFFLSIDKHPWLVDKVIRSNVDLCFFFSFFGSLHRVRVLGVNYPVNNIIIAIDSSDHVFVEKILWHFDVYFHELQSRHVFEIRSNQLNLLYSCNIFRRRFRCHVQQYTFHSQFQFTWTICRRPVINLLLISLTHFHFGLLWKFGWVFDENCTYTCKPDSK